MFGEGRGMKCAWGTTVVIIIWNRRFAVGAQYIK